MEKELTREKIGELQRASNYLLMKQTRGCGVVLMALGIAVALSSLISVLAGSYGRVFP